MTKLTFLIALLVASGSASAATQSKTKKVAKVEAPKAKIAKSRSPLAEYYADLEIPR